MFEYREIKKAELGKWIEASSPEYILIDVREKSELEHGTILTSHHVPCMF